MQDRGASFRPIRPSGIFLATKEPQGDAATPAGERLRFVIQKHDASRLHYDLRLELDGVFKSWAITRGPSLDPRDKRLAVEVEDHPLDYGDFEGTIPKGEYGGAAPSSFWDRGYWAPQGMTAEQGLAAGDLKFTLEGEHLHGSWVLVRMKGWSGKRVNWLLIKHRDEHAHPDDADALLAEDRSVASGRSMAEIAAGKGRAPRPFMVKTASRRRSRRMPCGIPRPASPPPCARAKKRARTPTPATAMPDFIEPQLCHSVERPPSGDGWLHEIKFDGYRVQLRIEGGKTVVRTRKGLDWTDRFGAIARACEGLPDAILDAEIVALDAEGAPDFAALQAALSDHKTDQLVCFAFDLLYAGGKDLRPQKLSERKAAFAGVSRGQGEAPPADPLCRAFRDRRRRRAALRLPPVAGGNRLQARQRALSARSQRELDQGEMPRRARDGDRRPGPTPAGSSAP